MFVVHELNASNQGNLGKKNCGRRSPFKARGRPATRSRTEAAVSKLANLHCGLATNTEATWMAHTRGILDEPGTGGGAGRVKIPGEHK